MEVTMKLNYRSRNGHERTRFCKKNSNGSATDRRKRVIDRLEVQLKLGNKPDENDSLIPLEEKDVKRINKEIETLRSRI